MQYAEMLLAGTNPLWTLVGLLIVVLLFSLDS